MGNISAGATIFYIQSMVSPMYFELAYAVLKKCIQV